MGRGNGTELIKRIEVRRISGAIFGYGTEFIIIKGKDDICIGSASMIWDIFILKQSLID